MSLEWVPRGPTDEHRHDEGIDEHSSRTIVMLRSLSGPHLLFDVLPVVSVVPVVAVVTVPAEVLCAHRWAEDEVHPG